MVLLIVAAYLAIGYGVYIAWPLLWPRYDSNNSVPGPVTTMLLWSVTLLVICFIKTSEHLECIAERIRKSAGIK